MNSRAWFARSALAVFMTFTASVPGCNGDDDAESGHAGGATMCTSSGGPVEDGAEDLHCTDDAGHAIIRSVGKCQTGGDVGGGGASGNGAAGAGGQSVGGDEEYLVLTGRHGADDDCKYDVSFTNGCIELNEPVTFTVTLTTRATGLPATKAHPDSPEVYLAEMPSHISPSFEISARESPDGTYTIGPVVFDRSGRWVVRFHFYETCSDLFEDSPHGHIAFYIDVP